MTFLEGLRYALIVTVTATLVWASVSDVATRRIPNKAVLSVLGLFVLWTLLTKGDGLGQALIAGGVAFAVGYGLYVFNIVGAGDAKLFAAVALFAGTTHLSDFALATALTGGAMAIVSLASRPRRALVIFALKGRGDFGRGIPYGVAISVGGALVLWGDALGLLPFLRSMA